MNDAGGDPVLPGTGLQSLDDVLGGIRAGDNVVWQVDTIGDYVPFVRAFTRGVVTRGNPLIYFSFGHHASLLPDGVDAHVVVLDPAAGFEGFLAQVFGVIEQFGRGACYVFDCLSYLAGDWCSDVMLGNFFSVTCPYLFDFDTATYFALIRNVHSPQVINAITGTAQVVIDVHEREGRVFIQPVKVHGRSSPTMYTLHEWGAGDEFIPVTASTVIAGIMTRVVLPRFDVARPAQDAWVATLASARDATGDPSMQVRLLKMLVAREGPMFDLARRYVNVDALLAISRRMIGTGLVGGKSVGMILARAILEHDAPGVAALLEPHDSFFVGSDVYYTFLVQNGCWWGRKRATTLSTFVDDVEPTRLRILEGKFPRDILDQFSAMLEYFGQSPVIVRSSSLLEDAYGNAFAGKYASIFCPNQGTPEQRLENFLGAVKEIYASTLSTEALAYRKARGLLDKDEQMALLVQRVSGDVHGGHMFFPQAAGVGYSFNPFPWDASVDPAAGLLRLVAGLGTRAVDRKDDHARLVALNVPADNVVKDLADVARYSQQRIDVLDLGGNRFDSPRIHKILPSILDTAPAHLFFTETGTGATPVTFDGLLRETRFPGTMRTILATLEAAYENPVDIEFTVNVPAGGEPVINMLQCRPLQVAHDSMSMTTPGVIPEGTPVIETSGPVIGRSVVTILDAIIYIDPAGYSALREQDRHAVARLVGRINKHPSLRGKQVLLAGPGRWGTSTPSLGVPVSFSEINGMRAICEIAEMHGGLVPDVSLGTHFFNDLVESDMLYFAINPGKPGHALDKARLVQDSALLDWFPDAAPLAAAVHVVLPASGTSLAMHFDVTTQRGAVVARDEPINRHSVT